MRIGLHSIVALVTGTALSSHARAQLWDGGGANNNWSTANNWNPNGVPVNDGTANVGFGGSVRLAPVVNGAVDVRSITFVSGAGAFDVNPGGFRFFLQIGAGGVTNSDNSTQTISNPIRLTAAQTWRANSGPLVFGSVDGQGNVLTVNGSFDTTIDRHTGTSSSLIKGGSGTLLLTGNGTSNGGVTINAGTLSIDADSRLGGNAVVINGGTLAMAADIIFSRNITLTAVGASLTGPTRQLSYDGGLLTVNGGSVTTFSGFIGAGLPSNGSAAINGTSSSWSMSNGLGVGYQDQGSLTIQAGGQVSNSVAHIGSLPGSSGVVTVTGPGSAWTSSGFLGIGYSGTGTLNIDNGGSVSADSCFVGEDPGSIGHVNIASGSWSVNGSPVIGDLGTGTMTISGGGTVTDSGAFIGRNTTGNGDVLVTGPGSTWTSNGILNIANSGTGTLTIQDDGLVTNTSYCMIGGNPGAHGSASVIGAMLNSTDLYVGSAGVGTLDVGPGGAVSSANGSIAGTTSANGSAVTIGGANATWTLSGDLSVGYGGQGSLTIQDTGRVTNQLTNVGAFNTGNGTATITGAGSVWANDNMAVGYLGSHGSLIVQNSGHVTSGNGTVGNSGTGSAIVTGAGSVWDVSGALTIGFFGTGTILVDQGGAMTTLLLSLGYGSGSLGTATIAGATSHWDIGSVGIRMCESGADSTLTINGGTFTVAGDITDGGPGTSTLTLDGGTLDVQNHLIGNATPIDALAFRSGTLRNVAGINNGAGLSKIGPGTLLLNTPNTYTGATTVSAGVLQVTNTSGSATGSGSVTIAAGATLSGTGRITGAVTNNGAVAPGTSPGTLRLTSAYTQNAGGSLNIEIGGTVAGTQYDRLAVGGAANLNGSLNVTLINNFAPAIGDTFDILAAGLRNGVFATLDLPPLNSGAWAIEYLPTIVRLSITGCSADFDADGFVTGEDFDAFVAAFELGDAAADFDLDGFVTGEDFDAYVAAFEGGC